MSKLLQAIINLTRAGGLRSIEQVYKVAKRELGDKFNAAKKQIDDAFKQGKEQKKLDDRTKDLKKTDEQGIKSLESDIKSIEQSTEKLKKISEKNKADIDDVFALKSDPVKTNTPVQKKLTKAVEEVRQQMKEIGSLSDADMQKKQIENALKLLRDKRIYEMGSGLEGDVRTALRQFLKKELDEGRLDIPDAREKDAIEKSYQGGVDPIDVFRKAYGEDALIAVDDIFEQYGNRLTGPTYRDIEENFRKLFKMNRGFYDMAELPVPKETYGFDEGVRSIDTVEEDLIKQYQQLDELDKFELPKDRKSNSMGGINRINFADGPKDPKKKALINTIKKIPKVGKIVGGAVEIINYVKTLDPIEAMKEVNKVITRKGKYKNVSEEDSQKIFEDTQDHIFEREYKPTEFEIDDDFIDAEEIESAKQLAPKMVERLQLKAKYPGIDDDLVDKILIDDNPQRKAEVLATLDEAFRMMEKGKGTDEIIDTFKNQNRTKQASGTGPEGLSQITDLYEKIRINNVQKQKDKEDNKQMRFRKLLASNKFPELNTFLEAELNEDDEKVELDVRTNFAVGSSPFTPEQIAQRKQQSYLDYLARQGVGQSGTTTGPAPTFNPFTGTSTTPPASGGSQPGTGSPGTGGGGGGTRPPNTGTGGGGNTNTGPGNPFYGQGNTGGGTGGSSGGSSGGTGGTSGGGNLYTGANNRPPSMGTNTGGSTPGSGGSTPGSGGSGLTPNTGDTDHGGGYNTGGGSIVGGSPGGATGSQAIEAYKNYLKNQSGGSPVSFDTFRRGTPYAGQLTFTTDNYDELQNIKNAVSGGFNSDGTYDRTMVNNLFPDTGDLGSEAANDAAYRGDPNSHPDYLAFKQMSSKEQRALLDPFMDRARKHVEQNLPPSQRNFENVKSFAQEYYRDSLMGADANDGFDDGLKKSTYDEEAEDDYFGDINSKGRIRDFDGVDRRMVTLEEYQNAKEAYGQALASGEYKQVHERGSTSDIRNFERQKYGAPLILTSETEINRYNRARDLKAPRSDGKYADQVNKLQPMPKDVGGGLKKFAGKIYNAAGQVVDTAGRILDSRPGQLALTIAKYKSGVPILENLSKLKTVVDTVNKGRDTIGSIRDAYDDAIDDSLYNVPGYTGNIDLREENKTGGRVGKAVGGSLDLEARKKQSQADFLARQPGAQPPQPQPPTAKPAQPFAPQQPAVNPQPPAVNPQPPAVNPQPPTQAPVPFDMSKYQGGTFSGGIEDSRNIALNSLARLGVDTSKYSKTTATDTSGPKFKGLSLNEIFAMDLNTAKDKLGFDPADPDASPEFEEFLRVNDPGPMAIGPGGPPGMKTEFTNQDELAQILNRAIPNFMEYAQELGENYTLDEMLAMSDDELAMIEDRYDKKMGYGKYRTSYVPNTGSRDKSQAQETMEQYKDIQRQGTGIGLGSQYAKGGRVNFKYGSDRYGQSKKVMSAMNVDYNDPFKKLMSNDSGRFIKSTSSLARYAKNLNKLKNSKQAKAALRKNLLVKNEKARKDALKRLSLLQKMYAGGKKSV
jgi:hypothetical protein